MSLELAILSGATEFLQTGDCYLWDEACKDRQERELQIRELEAQTASQYLLDSKNNQSSIWLIVAIFMVIIGIGLGIYFVNKNKY